MLSEYKKNIESKKNIYPKIGHLLIGGRSVKILTSSLFFAIIGILSILSIFLIEFIGGFTCNPLIILPLLPAKMASYIVLLYSIIMLIFLTFRTIFKNIRQVYLPVTSLIIVIGSLSLFFQFQSLNCFLYGLNTRFKTQFGYSKMREFAKEIIQKPEGIVSDSSLAEDPRHSKDQSKRQELAKKYPFLGWHKDHGGVYIIEDIVEMTWGSALSGHWGFQVALKGKVSPIEKGTSLKVADDIQFVYFED